MLASKCIFLISHPPSLSSFYQIFSLWESLYQPMRLKEALHTTWKNMLFWFSGKDFKLWLGTRIIGFDSSLWVTVLFNWPGRREYCPQKLDAKMTEKTEFKSLLHLDRLVLVSRWPLCSLMNPSQSALAIASSAWLTALILYFTQMNRFHIRTGGGRVKPSLNGQFPHQPSTYSSHLHPCLPFASTFH